MAVETYSNGKQLVIRFRVDAGGGKTKLVSKTFSSIDQDATDEKLYSSAMALVDLQERSLEDINKREMHGIVSI